MKRCRRAGEGGRCRRAAEGAGATGKIALYGIYFDTDKAQVKPESKRSSTRWLLTANPALKVYIVGHTDNGRQLAHNVDLSQRRAEAVTQALATTYRIARRRVWSRRASPLAGRV